MLGMPNTLVTLAVTRDGRPITINVGMSGDDFEAAVRTAENVVKFPTGGGAYTYVNPAHIAMARATTGDEPQVRLLGTA
jgi:hypothetical protein